MYNLAISFTYNVSALRILWNGYMQNLAFRSLPKIKKYQIHVCPAAPMFMACVRYKPSNYIYDDPIMFFSEIFISIIYCLNYLPKVGPTSLRYVGPILGYTLNANRVRVTWFRRCFNVCHFGSIGTT